MKTPPKINPNMLSLPTLELNVAITSYKFILALKKIIVHITTMVRKISLTTNSFTFY